ncbi:hypothetical protein J3R30DRAFT_706475 [Lentinula aciculospora]|uniref:CUE domain-containing protein n=1 Tax=Lentinula aciculospora TaxID=153920 RepID=A0A9W9A4C4_9AGAR|nr:hypothetical protein J3R30DRAFT_706475 [Lentinula aciculospora]
MATHNSIATRIPLYPSISARKALSPSQLAKLNATILACITDVLSLPSAKRNTPAARSFVSTYAKDSAVQTLQALIWNTEVFPSKIENSIRSRVLQLAEKLDKLDVQTLLDLAIAYAKTNPNRLRAVLEVNSSSLASTDLISPFILLLRFENSPGLYALRKTSHCITSLLCVAPSATLRAFAHSKDFILALATVYQTGLNAIAQSYGGFNLTRSSEAVVDDWEKLWLETKVSFMDSFHACMACLLNDIASASGQALAVEAEATFDIVFALLESNSTAGQPQTPFLNRSILADYQQSYDLMRTLSSSFRLVVERDARLDLLDASLRELDTQSGRAEAGKQNPGALKLLLRSSGVPASIDSRGIGSGRSKDNKKGREKEKEVLISATAASSSQSSSKDYGDLDVKVGQVLDILPDQPPEYIRDLLMHPSYPFAGNADSAERVIGALLEGTAPPWSEVRNASKAAAAAEKSVIALQPIERRNIFDGEEVVMSRFIVGKKSEDKQMLFRDRETIEQMKADILRRVEEFSSSEEEDEVKSEDIEDDQLDSTAVNKIKVAGDGEDSDPSDSEDDGDIEPTKLSLETILELAYIENPKLFDQDSATRSSQPRQKLKEKTGWGDVQIEGWRIMLDRDPKKKERMLKKHEWSGNRSVLTVKQPEASWSREGRGQGGIRGRGSNPTGHERSRGGGSRGGGGGGPDNARERALKEKNKNKARKRGHDKKMSRSGARPPT